MKRILLALVCSSLAQIAISAKSKWTYYYIAFEDDESGTGAKNTNIGTCKGENIATVTSQYAKSLAMEGTGKLNDGRVANSGSCSCSGGYNCFEIID